MRYTVRYLAGTYEGERTVFAEDEDHAIAKVKAWVHAQMSVPMYAQAYEIVEVGEPEPNRCRRYTRNASELTQARNVRRTFMDREPEHKEQVPWEWPRTMQHIGQCEAVMYSSDKWKTNGQAEDYKHVAEGKQQLLVTPGFVREYNRPRVELGVVGPKVNLNDPMPTHFAVLAKVLGFQARLFVGDDDKQQLGDESLYQIDVAGATLGAAKHPETGETFLIIYTDSGAHCVITGAVLDIEKDGIVG